MSVSRECRRENLAVFNSGLAGWFNAALLNAATLVAAAIALLNAATLVDVTLVDVAANRFSTHGAELVSFSEKISAICTIGHILGDISLRDVIVQKFGELLLSNDFHEGTGNIGGADGHDAFDDDAHALLVLVACHFSRHTFELSFHHTD